MGEGRLSKRPLTADLLSARAGVRVAAAALGIPPAAVAVEISARTETRGTLLDERTSKAAGLQVRNLGPGGECTLGFNATWGGEGYFVSASHCSDSTFGPDIYQQSGMYQPDWGAGRDSIAEEAFDPSLSTGGSFPTSGPPAGTVVQKVGRSSGWTYGTVTATCRDLFADASETQQLRCQWITSVYSEPGDSGSPIFSDAGDGSVILQGLLWGGPLGDPYTSYYSPISGIETDLEKTLNVERPAPPPAAPTITAEVVNQNPYLTWNAVPGVQQYRIYRRISRGYSEPPWEGWNTVSVTSYIDESSMVTSLYGYDTYPGGQVSVSYQVRAVGSGGTEGSGSNYATFIPKKGIALPTGMEQ